MQDIAEPLLALATGKLSNRSDLLVAITFFFFSLLWSNAQRSAILGGEGRSYFNTLPFGVSTTRLVDCLILFIANNILWIPIVTAYAIVVLKSPTLIDHLQGLLGLTALVFCMQCMQFFLLLRMFKGALLAIMLSIVVFFSGFYFSDILYIIVIFGIFVAGYFLYFYYRERSASSVLIVRAYNAITSHAVKLRTIFSPILALQIDILFDDNKTQGLMRLLASVGLMLLIVASIIQDNSVDYAFNMILIGACIVVMILAKYFCLLNEAHKPVQPYLNTLPVHRWFWQFHDMILILLVSFALLLPSLSILMYFALLSLIECFFLCLLMASLVVVMRYVVLFSQRHSVLYTGLAVSVWITAGIFLHS